MRVTYASSSLTLDLDVTVVDPAVSIGVVITAITGRAAGPTAVLDGLTVRADEAIGSLPVRNGSTIGEIDMSAARHGGDRDNAGEPVVTVTRVAGEQSGQTMTLSEGTYDIGPARRFDDVEPVVRIRVLGERCGPETVSIQRLGDETILVDGKPLDGAAIEGNTIELEDVVLRLVGRPLPKPIPLPLVEGGRIPHQRSPRRLGDSEPLPPSKPSPADDPQQAQPFSWIVALAPLPIGIIAAIFFSPFFLIFLLMTPILTVGRWYESRRRSNKDQLRHAAETDSLVSGYADELRDWARTVEHHRRRRQPDLVRLAEVAFGVDPGLWQRRTEHDDFLHLAVGIGAERTVLAQGEIARCNELDAEVGRLHTIPVTVDLTSETAIGIVGDRGRARRLANAMLTELTVTHGPADITLALLIDPARQIDWDWTKWLPQLEDERGYRNVVYDTAAAARLLADLKRPTVVRGATSSLVSPVPIVLVDGDRFLDGAFVALSSAVRANAARAIVLADSPFDLPAICSTIVDVGHSGRAIVTSMRNGAERHDVLPILLSTDQAAGVVRHLSAYTDPDRVDEAADLPNECDLRSLIGGEIAPNVLTDRWITTSATPRGMIGVAADGGLALDLVRDGPHALIAGTTGSGKSELLRSLIAGLVVEQGPDRINFVLIDFKGGGAFDACADLPHTVGVVTDLDEHLASRALRCLKAELTHRESVLRKAGVSDLRDYPKTEAPLPRLVVVVDEFATLAAELPDFMNSLVDIAQRGRSLGIHMVLATQRPAGVVDAKIRANTNLRISLRVQDAYDSEDVIGDVRAASIDRRSPGRGYVRLGASELTQFQTAIVSRSAVTAAVAPIRIAPFELSTPPGGVGPDGVVEALEGDGLTDLSRLAAAATGAAEALGLAAPRVPWPQPVPTEVDAASLGLDAPAAADQVDRWAAPLGIADMPDEQRTEEFWWSTEVGNLLIYGTEAASTASVISTLTVGLGRFCRRLTPHVYVIDFSSGGALTPLAALAHVGGVITAADEERLVRTIDLLEREMVKRGELARSLGVPSLGAEHGVPLALLAIANYGGLAGFLEESNLYELGGRLERIVRDGPPLGIFVVATANHDRAVPSRLASQVDAKLVMRLADSTSYTAFGLRANDVPDLAPGRAIDTRTGLEIQVARYRPVTDQAEASIQEVCRSDAPAGVKTLGTDIDPRPLVTGSTQTRTGVRLVLGQRHHDLAPAAIELRPGLDLVIAGPAGSGKTTALRAIVAAASHAADQCRVIVRSEEPESWPGFESELPMEHQDRVGPTLVVIDGIAAASDEFAHRLSEMRHDRLWVAIADRPERLQVGPSWLRTYTAARTGLLLQPQPDHGDLFRVRLSLRSGRPLPAGRGYLVDAGVPDLVQVVNTTEIGVPTPRVVPDIHQSTRGGQQ